MDKSANLVPRTVHDELDFLRARLARLVTFFNEDHSWESGLKSQVALVAVDDIAGGDADLDARYEL
jgi:hypothetical protein